MGLKSFLRPKQRALIELRRLAEFRARRAMRREASLWDPLHAYLAQTQSTGCSYSDYWALYSHVRRTGAHEILECGTGVSTVVLAAALAANERDGQPRGRVTSMEDHERWLEMSRKLLPEDLACYVDFVLSPSEEASFSLFRGMHYRDVPQRPYDFVFVDGPSYRAPDGSMTFDLDLLEVVGRSETPVCSIVDKRVSTCWVLQQVLGVEKVRFDPALGLGFIAPVTRADLRLVREDTPSRSFSGSYALLGSTRLAFTPEASRRSIGAGRT